MLRLLHIENIAVIESADIEFSEGFNVLTGETGAGKSVVIGSAGALLGGRVSRELIRRGASKGFVSGVFSDLSQPVCRALSEMGLAPEPGEELILSREIKEDGKNICRISGRPVPLTTFREIGRGLIALHGQQDTKGLMDENNHLGMLDRFAALEPDLLAYRTLYDRLRALKREIRALQMDEEEKERRVALLTARKEEIEAAALSPGEEARLSERRKMLRSAEKLTGAVDSAYLNLYGGEDAFGACEGMSAAAEAIRTVAPLSERFSSLADRLDELRYGAEEALRELSDIRQELEFSPGELDEVERRSGEIDRLKKKYGATVEEVIACGQNAAEELSKIFLSQETLEQMTCQYKKEYEKAVQLAEIQHQKRLKAAEELSKRIDEELAQLNMKHARFVPLLTRREREGKLRLTASGFDECVFLMETNEGEGTKPLSKIASGGELSRVMLALQNALVDKDGADTMIFDEIDAGVSGRAAVRVGEKLYQAALGRQVLCVTHLAQIAAMADRHLLIEKQEKDGRTRTTISPVEGDARREELSRIISGGESTASAMETAAAMVCAARDKKETIRKGKENSHDGI